MPLFLPVFPATTSILTNSCKVDVLDNKTSTKRHEHKEIIRIIKNAFKKTAASSLLSLFSLHLEIRQDSINKRLSNGINIYKRKQHFIQPPTLCTKSLINVNTIQADIHYSLSWEYFFSNLSQYNFNKFSVLSILKYFQISDWKCYFTVIEILTKHSNCKIVKIIIKRKDMNTRRMHEPWEITIRTICNGNESDYAAAYWSDLIRVMYSMIDTLTWIAINYNFMISAINSRRRNREHRDIKSCAWNRWTVETSAQSQRLVTAVILQTGVIDGVSVFFNFLVSFCIDLRCIMCIPSLQN